MIFTAIFFSFLFDFVMFIGVSERNSIKNVY